MQRLKDTLMVINFQPQDTITTGGILIIEAESTTISIILHKEFTMLTINGIHISVGDLKSKATGLLQHMILILISRIHITIMMMIDIQGIIGIE